MLYDVATHPFLSSKSQQLGARFESHHRMAEALLGLRAPVVTAERDLEDMELAVAMQINFQAEQGLDPFVVESSSSSHTSQSVHYRDRAVDPRAVALVNEVDRRGKKPYGRWNGLTSVRTQ